MPGAGCTRSPLARGPYRAPGVRGGRRARPDVAPRAVGIRAGGQPAGRRRTTPVDQITSDTDHIILARLFAVPGVARMPSLFVAGCHSEGCAEASVSADITAERATDHGCELIRRRYAQ
jgi:hypothetical protein